MVVTHFSTKRGIKSHAGDRENSFYARTPDASGKLLALLQSGGAKTEVPFSLRIMFQNIGYSDVCYVAAPSKTAGPLLMGIP